MTFTSGLLTKEFMKKKFLYRPKKNQVPKFYFLIDTYISMPTKPKLTALFFLGSFAIITVRAKGQIYFSGQQSANPSKKLKCTPSGSI